MIQASYKGIEIEMEMHQRAQEGIGDVTTR